jgi:hypothetical protein
MRVVLVIGFSTVKGAGNNPCWPGLIVLTTSVGPRGQWFPLTAHFVGRLPTRPCFLFEAVQSIPPAAQQSEAAGIFVTASNCTSLQHCEGNCAHSLPICAHAAPIHGPPPSVETGGSSCENFIELKQTIMNTRTDKNIGKGRSRGAGITGTHRRRVVIPDIRAKMLPPPFVAALLLSLPAPTVSTSACLATLSPLAAQPRSHTPSPKTTIEVLTTPAPSIKW